MHCREWHRELRPNGGRYQSKSCFFSHVTGNCEHEEELEDTMLELLKRFTEGLKDDAQYSHLRLDETPCEVQRHIPKMQDLGDTRGGGDASEKSTRF